MPTRTTGELPTKLEPTPAPRATDVPRPETRAAGQANDVPSPLARIRADLQKSPVQLKVMDAAKGQTPGMLQVRTLGDAKAEWQDVKSGQEMSGAYEFRTTATGETSIMTTIGPMLRLHRSSRGSIYILQAINDDAPSARRLTIELIAGRADVQPEGTDGRRAMVSLLHAGDLLVIREAITAYIEEGTIKTTAYLPAAPAAPAPAQPPAPAKPTE
ncbi:MAG: hypothetical protein K2X32_12945 [Phycisphaerales bacterium]|nr:hypothetical protein [Phycisphaerales bacterium]